MILLWQEANGLIQGATEVRYNEWDIDQGVGRAEGKPTRMGDCQGLATSGSCDLLGAEGVWRGHF